MENFGYYPKTGWKGLERKKTIWQTFMSGLRRFMDEVCR